MHYLQRTFMVVTLHQTVRLLNIEVIIDFLPQGAGMGIFSLLLSGIAGLLGMVAFCGFPIGFIALFILLWRRM